MATLYNKHDINNLSTYVGSDGVHKYNNSWLRSLNTRASLGGGGTFQTVSDSFLTPGSVYYSTSGTIVLAILDLFYTNRYTAWVSPNTPGGWSQSSGTWVAWSFYDTTTYQFTGPYCGAGTSTRLSFSLTPLDLFPEFAAKFTMYPYSWSSVIGGSAPTRNFSASTTVYYNGTTLSNSGGSIVIKNGQPSNTFTLGGKTLRFHGFLSYSGAFASTEYAFVTINNLNSTNHTSTNASYGGSTYPARPTTTITHKAIPMCTLVNSGSVQVASVYTPGGVFTAETLPAFPGTPVNGIRTIYPDVSTPVTDVNTNNTINIPKWMVGDIFSYNPDIFEGGEMDYLASGWYGDSNYVGYWDVTTGEWSQYQAYGSPPTYYTWYISIILDPMNNEPACNNIPITTYVGPVYTSEGALGVNVNIYSDTNLTAPYNLPDGEGWYTFRDSNNQEIRPLTVYRLDPGARIADVHICG